MTGIPNCSQAFQYQSIEPSLQLLASIRCFGIEAANDRKSAWKLGGRLQYALIGVTDPCGRDDDGPVDSNFIHLRKDFLGAKTIGPMRGTLQSFHPRAVRSVDLPKVNLGISDEHGCLR